MIVAACMHVDDVHTMTEQITAGIEHTSDGQEQRTLSTRHVMENPMYT